MWRGINEGLNAVIVNPTVIIGAGNWKNSSMKIFNTIQKNPKYYPSGANAFVDARDIAQIMFKLMQHNIFNERFLCTGENARFKKLFALVSKVLNLNPPTKEVNSTLMKLVWVLSSVWAVITFSKTNITKSVVTSSCSTTKYSNQKIKSTLGHEFYSLEEMVDNAVKGRLS